MSHEPGSKVLAVRDGDEKTIYYYGTGTYVGDEVPPNAGEMDEETRRIIEQSIAEMDSGEAEEGVKELLDLALERKIIDQAKYDEDLAQAKVKLQEDRKRPMADRVQELWLSSRENPKIVLDDDKGVVWGYQCWWGPEESFKKKYPDHEFVKVDLPTNSNG
jgi:hypothetical protein